MRALSLCDQPRRDAFLHQQPRAGAADLPLVEPDRVDHAFDDAVEVGVVEDDERRLAAELQRQLLAAAGGGFADDPADSVEPVKAILSTSGWLTIASPVRAVAGDDVDHAGRQADLLAHLGERAAR